jgi:dUTP pyrophosphatase
MMEENKNLDLLENELKTITDEYSDDESTIDYDRLIKDFGIDIDGIEEEINSYAPKIYFRYSQSHQDLVDPKYAYPTDSGFDLHSVEEISIEGFGRGLVPTGLHLDIPENYEIQIRSKSGLALKQGLMVLNSPGTVDQGYTGEIKVIIFNTTKETVKIEKGQKIAQAVLCPVVSGKWITLVEKKEINEKDRNANGFGSTGLV